MSLTKIDNIVTVGASITDSQWWTWKDFLEFDSGLNLTNLAIRGCGNEFMVHQLMNNSKYITEKTIVIIMFTNVDKFDWYVHPSTFELLSKEKHKPIDFGDRYGFWCTGSWFPEQKQIFKNNFYSEDYFTVKTIQQILLAQQLQQVHKFKLIITFDSPAWTYTEQELNQITEGKSITNEKNVLLNGPLSKKWATSLDKDFFNLDSTSLIGYCMKNNLLWHNKLFKGHPPSGSHYKWYQDVLLPQIQKYINVELSSDYLDKIETMDELWQEKF